MTAPKLEARHLVSGLNSHFTGESLPFADWIAQKRNMIAKVRADSGATDSGKIVEGNAPFELWPSGTYQTGQTKPYRRGVLLVHGLSDSPYFMRYLAAFYQQYGFRVMVVLLPGHGTQPGDLLDVSWQEWAKAVAYGTDQLDAEVDQVYLAGFSAGAALGIYQSLRDQRVRGLFMFSPALRITHRAAWAKWHKLYSWLVPSAKWLSIMPDADIYKYESMPKNAVAQMYALTQQIDRELRQLAVTIPVFTAASMDDVTVDVTATLEFMVRAPHPSNRLVLYTTDTNVIPPGIPQEKLELVESAVSEQNILSFAHTAIVLPPDDAHYGAAGDYANCLHYFPHDMQKYAACSSNASEVLQGEVTEQNLRTGVMRRLMYNPHFAALKDSMHKFIESLP